MNPFWVFSSNMTSNVINIFSDPENLCLDLSITSLGGIITILDDFYSFGIMADNHNVLIKVFLFISYGLMYHNMIP